MKINIAPVSETVYVRKVFHDNGKVTQDRAVPIRDTNLVDLYENDVVVYNGVCFLVYWTGIAWSLKDANNKPIKIDGDRMMEVFASCTSIGNVHAHPELLVPPSILDIQTDIYPSLEDGHSFGEWEVMYEIAMSTDWEKATQYADKARISRDKELDMMAGEESENRNGED